MSLTAARQASSDHTSDEAAHVTSTEPSELKRILEPEVNLCVWQRSPMQELSRELSLLHARHLPDVRCVTSLETFAEDLAGLLGGCGLPAEEFAAWRADLQRLARLYFPLARGRKVTLRLETTDQDGCRRFHADRTHLRLLCTYRGPGTEWLTNTQVDRDAQYAGAPNEEILRFGAPSQLQTFWVGILKGSAYPGNTDHGLVHRSPPVANSGQVRVLVCLDS